MESLTSLYLPGALTIWCALLFAVVSLWGYASALRGTPEEQQRSVAFARRAYTFFALSVVLAAFVLAFCLITRDFRIEYVYQYSGLELPVHYQFAAFWAGQKGSFLIWLFWGALLGLPLLRTAGRQEPTVMIVYTLTLLGLIFILVRENPFVMLAQAPVDGQGLNPLLQDDWMVIHPPIMFIGYAAAAIPFSFAVAALWRKDYKGWAARAFPWTLIGFLVLGTAILMGGYWAYKTLGWGGYWGWDPVENASLIPWILGTVLIHGLYLERTKGRYRRANYVLAVLVYMAVLYGTFLTRSGVLADFSVHSFVDLGISGWLIAVMAFFGLGSLALLVLRLPKVPVVPNEDPLISRGTAVVLGTITLVASALVITFGTSAPLLTFFLENPGQVGPEFYNRVNLPVAVLLALLLGVVPFLTWKGESAGTVLRKVIPAAIFGAIVAAASFALGVTHPLHLIYLFLAALALGSNLQKVVQKARTQGLKTAGGYLTHVGVGIMLIGFIASSAYDQSTKITLPLNEPQQVGGMTLEFAGFPEASDPRGRERLVVQVTREDGSTYEAYPELFRNQRTGQVMAHPHVRTFPLLDLYISPLEYEPGDLAGAANTLQLARGQSQTLGRTTFRFVDFDLGVEEDTMANMTSGVGPVTIGVRVEVSRPGEVPEEVMPIYRADQATNQVTAPPVFLPGGGGALRLMGIDPTRGVVRLEASGVPTVAAAEVTPPHLAVDVTKKPLIQLVWLGLYVVLAGGVLSTLLRLRQARTLETLPVQEG